MINVTIITNAGQSKVMVSEDATIREILEENNVNYATGVTSIDGCPLHSGDMDKTFADMGVEARCYLSCVVKADSAATAVIAGSSCVITSTMKLEDLKTIKALRPKALVMYEGEGKDKEPVFAIGVTERSAGSINENGATFGPVVSKDGYATITMNFGPDVEDPAKKVEETYGLGLLRLNQLEKTFESVLEEIKAEKESIHKLVSAM